MIPRIANHLYELPHELSNYLRLKDLGKLGNIRKIPNLGRDIAQCPVSLPEIKFSNSSQKTRTNRYQTFLALSSFSGFLYFVPNILFGIAAPRRCCLGYSKVYCDVRKRWLLAWNQNRHITYSIFHILTPKSVLQFRKTAILCPMYNTVSNVFS